MGLAIFEFLNKWRFNQTFISEAAHRSIISEETWNRQQQSAKFQKFFGVLKQMLAWFPDDRMTAQAALDWVLGYENSRLGGVGHDSNEREKRRKV
jgi:transposase InsO family protein